MKRLIFTTLFLSIFSVSSALAHPGRTDANGCHNDRGSGGYHCHGSSSGGYSPPSGGTSQPTIPSNGGYRPPSGGTPRPVAPTNREGNIIQFEGNSNSRSRGAALPLAKVVSTGDGDTIRVNQGGQTITLRLACVDAPEMAQAPWGQQSANRLQQLLPIGQTVRLRVIDRDQYGRTVAEVFKGNQSVNLQIVREGMAVVYRQYLNGCNSNQYLQAEVEAKQKKRGYWKQNNPVMPWDFRRANRAAN